MRPYSSVSRYLTASELSEKASAMPKIAVTHIQKIAPAPPSVMAVATPARLPVPTCPDSAVDKACQGVMAPSSPCAFRPSQTSFRAGKKRRRGLPPKRNIKNRPVPSRTNANGPIGRMDSPFQAPPQMNPLIFWIRFTKFSMGLPGLLLD